MKHPIRVFKNSTSNAKFQDLPVYFLFIFLEKIIFKSVIEIHVTPLGLDVKYLIKHRQEINS